MDAFDLVRLVIGLGGVLAVLATLYSRRRRTNAKHNTSGQLGNFFLPTTRIGNASEGEVVKVVGHVRSVNDPVIGPLSGRPCAYYDVQIQEFVNGSWQTLVEERRGRHFVLEDESARIGVRMVGIHAEVKRDFVVNPDEWARYAHRLRAVCERRETRLGMVRTFPTRAREGTLEEGERIAVAGIVRAVSDSDGASTAAAFRRQPQVLRLEAPPHGRLLLSDHPDMLDT